MFKKFQRLEVSITDLADGQKSFGRMPDGLAVFVEGPAAVGDRVAATITGIKKNFLEAKLVEVIEPSPLRTQPVCSHFGVCGGCKWQHVQYAEQLRIKRKMVADALQRIGGFVDAQVAETVPAPRVYGYRNKVEFSFGDRRYLLQEEMDHPTQPVDFALGFHAAGRFEKVLNIDRCHIATDKMNQALFLAKSFAQQRKISCYSVKTHEGFLRNLVLRESFSTGEFMVYLITSSHDPEIMKEFRTALGDLPSTFVNGITKRMNNVAYAEEQIVLSGSGTITERLGDYRFVISPNSFFQTNSEQAMRLYQVALDMAELRPGDHVFDLYCGTGTISIFISKFCRKVIGYEQELSSVRDAEKNASLNNVANCSFQQVDLNKFAGAAVELPDVVITDPPRAGMHAKTVEQLRQLRPRRIIYVSCNPASLARDGQLLCADGLYALGPVQPVDLFPHTYHVESVARFDRTT